MNRTKLIYFVAGVVTGSIGAVVTQKAHFFFTHRKYEIKEPDFDMSEYDISPEENEEYSAEDMLKDLKTGRSEMSEEETEEIKEKLQNNLERTTHYAKMYKRSNEDAEEDNIEDEEEMEAKLEWDIEANEDHQKNKGKAPKIISYEATKDLPDYIEMRDLYYWYYDTLLANEEGEILDPDIFTGDCLYKFGFDSNPDEELIYVMNYRLDTCYAVHKELGDFTPLAK